MKRSFLLLAGCLAPLSPAADAAAQSAIVRPAPEVQDQDQSNVATLRRAARILRSKGYKDESKRLVEIAAEMNAKAKAKPKAKAKSKAKDKAKRGDDRAPWAAARARKILKGDINDKAVRVKALELVADGYKRAGDKANAEAMAWFAAVGKSQVKGEPMPTEPTPEAVMSGDGNAMERLTAIIQRGAELQMKKGNREVARVHQALAKFYVNRSKGTPDAEQAQPPSREDDLTYIEGRLAALRIAERAYALDLPMRDEVREGGAERMAWMVALARLRVEGEGVEVPPVPSPGPVNMKALIETIRAAGKLHARAGDTRAAKRTLALADYYTKREAGEVVDNSATPRLAQRLTEIGYAGDPETEEESEPDLEEQERRRALEMRRQELERRIAEVRARLEAAKAELEAIRARGGR